MKKDSSKKAAAPAESASAKTPAKAAGRAKASMKAAVTRVAAKAKKAVTKAASSVKRRASGETVVKASAAPATIIVRHDAGWGNSITLRGEGPGLSWETGAPMCCVNGVEWVWVSPAAGTVQFKVLHNDHTWALGDNLVVAPGETVTVTPVF